MAQEPTETRATEPEKVIEFKPVDRPVQDLPENHKAVVLPLHTPRARPGTTAKAAKT